MSNQTENVCAPLVDKHDGDTEIEATVEEVEMKSYNGVMMPKYIDGREVLRYPNAGKKIKIIDEVVERVSN